MNLSPAQRELFELLTQRTLYVVDTEYTAGRDSNRLISIAVAPIVGGRRAPATEELYVEMNPTAPISAGASAVNGFTDQMVARKRRFGHYAPAIIAAFADPEGVFVQHTSADIRVLLGELELELLGPAAGSLPSMPLIDTSVLPRLLRYPGVGSRGVISLVQLCSLTKVKNTAAHHARHDARATADALVELLAHAAQGGKYTSLEQLLADHDQGTTREPRGPQFIRRRRASDPVLPDEHVARHGQPLRRGRQQGRTDSVARSRDRMREPALLMAARGDPPGRGEQRTRAP